MDKVDEYILQRFPNKKGKEETNKPYECRQAWFNNDFPSFKDLEKICNTKETTIQNYSSEYRWKTIRQKAQDLQAELDREKEKEKQTQGLNNLDDINDIKINGLLSQAEYLEKKLKDPLSEFEKKEIRQELRQIYNSLSQAQKDKLRTLKLPEKINDKQDHKHTGQFEMNHRMKKFLDPKNITGTE